MPATFARDVDCVMYTAVGDRLRLQPSHELTSEIGFACNLRTSVAGEVEWRNVGHGGGAMCFPLPLIGPYPWSKTSQGTGGGGPWSKTSQGFHHRGCSGRRVMSCAAPAVSLGGCRLWGDYLGPGACVASHMLRRASGLEGFPGLHQ